MLKAALRTFLLAFLAYSAFSYGISLLWSLPFFQTNPRFFYLAAAPTLALPLGLFAARTMKALSVTAAVFQSTAACLGFLLPTPLFFFLIGYGRMLLFPELPTTWGTEFLATMALGLMGVPIAFFSFLGAAFAARKWRRT